MDMQFEPVDSVQTLHSSETINRKEAERYEYSLLRFAEPGFLGAQRRI